MKLSSVSTLLLAATLTCTGAFAAEMQPYSPEAVRVAVAQARPLVYHVHATWCPVCAKQDKVLETLLKEDAFKDYVFIQVDFDRDKPMVETLGAKMQSTFVVAKGGNEVARTTGVTDPEKLRALLLKAGY
jgi:thioredoxin 1